MNEFCSWIVANQPAVYWYALLAIALANLRHLSWGQYTVQVRRSVFAQYSCSHDSAVCLGERPSHYWRIRNMRPRHSERFTKVIFCSSVAELLLSCWTTVQCSACINTGWASGYTSKTPPVWLGPPKIDSHAWRLQFLMRGNEATFSIELSVV